ncbi:class I SAM-dependent methyltransferase [Mucilaginibacter sp. UR6-1]|uniref:class I SAM-dependent methyltransferase n=1 Tax=Mucilaginibacter sp. UR6-1 TaxID=1435643 RepID=UPI001E2A21CD|nr:methyltransferase domain-containing protein [Mucilaginibacter sp. UR6-1]MCC8410055.1 class I SAM-dependent methyltransferase [Mucilaginibacter sp. UR6-1]
MSDILGQAIHNYYHGDKTSKLWIYNRYGPREEMPVKTYFRGEDDMPDLEWCALNRCEGTVLDIGAGAGSHSLVLQQWGTEVTALEISPLAAEVITGRGVRNVLQADIFTYADRKFDTLLLLMNGIGLAASLDGMRRFLRHAKTLLNDGGQLLFDSSDVSYLYADGLPDDGYYGEIWYQYAYKGQRTDWFSWLYVDEQTMLKIAAEEGWNTEVIFEDEYGQYLTRLTLNS